MTSASKRTDTVVRDEVPLPAGTLVVGDLHLDVEEPREVERFTSWLGRLATERLVILGDLFEYWIGDKALESPGAREVARALEEFTRRKGPVDLIPGNRDFLVGQRFVEASGVRLWPNGFIGRSVAGERILFLHGDELVTSDVSYQRYRSLVRRPIVRSLAARLPRSVSDAIARRMRRISAKEVQRKDLSATDVVLVDAKKALDEHAATALVCGHVHRHRVVELKGGGHLYIVDALGDGRWDACRIASKIDLVRSGIAANDSPRHPSTSMIVAIDGPAGAGKSTVARRIADALGLAFLDTGAMYRAVTLAVLEQGEHPSDHFACERVAKSLDLTFDAEGHIVIDGVPGEPAIRSQTVTLNVSSVSAHPQVRDAIVAQQREIAANLGGVVAEGRDTTTVVFPDATYKFFLDASPAERARRRAKQNGELDRVQEIQADIERRDKLDTTRAHSPLTRADDAIFIDGDGLEVDEVVSRVLTEIRTRAER